MTTGNNHFPEPQPIAKLSMLLFPGDGPGQIKFMLDAPAELIANWPLCFAMADQIKEIVRVQHARMIQAQAQQGIVAAPAEALNQLNRMQPPNLKDLGDG